MTTDNKKNYPPQYSERKKREISSASKRHSSREGFQIEEPVLLGATDCGGGTGRLAQKWPQHRTIVEVKDKSCVQIKFPD